MKKNLFTIAVLYIFFLLSGRAYGAGEQTIVLGGDLSWQTMETRQGIGEASGIRPNPVLLLSGYAGEAAFLDLDLSFNEGQAGHFVDSRGRYAVSVSPGLRAAPAPWSRTGAAAALFTGAGGQEPLALYPLPGALFAEGSHVQDFSLEFWLYPQTIENGAQILSWTSYKPDLLGDFIYQRIQSTIVRNRTQWNFDNFFSSPGRTEHQSLILSGPPLVPRTWSHHLIRFDADIGLLEYWVNGELEAASHATATGRERGEVFTPVIGQNGRWALGAHFSGMIDVFRVHSRRMEVPAQAQFHSLGGRVESRPLDLGRASSRVLRIEASGGRTSSVAGVVRNEYTGSNPLDFADHSAVHFFVRTSDGLHHWDDSPWIPVTPGTDIAGGLQGRFVQIAADFFPSADGQTSPYLSEVRLIYHAAAPPPPPTNLIAVAHDGAVELSWRASPSRELGGYLVYFGIAPGEYFGDNAIIDGVRRTSPIDVGNRTSVRIEGLTNGRLYFFAVAAYNGQAGLPEAGDFSREVAVRPRRMAE